MQTISTIKSIETHFVNDRLAKVLPSLNAVRKCSIEGCIYVAFGKVKELNKCSLAKPNDVSPIQRDLSTK